MVQPRLRRQIDGLRDLRPSGDSQISDSAFRIPGTSDSQPGIVVCEEGLLIHDSTVNKRRSDVVVNHSSIPNPVYKRRKRRVDHNLLEESLKAASFDDGSSPDRREPVSTDHEMTVTPLNGGDVTLDFEVATQWALEIQIVLVMTCDVIDHAPCARPVRCRET